MNSDLDSAGQLPKDFKSISVIGLGYIGLPTAAMFASHNIQVIGVDTDKVVVETINRGEIHIIEPDLDVAVRLAVRAGFLRAALTPEPADAFLIAVPTPFKGEAHDPDLSYVKSATNAVASVLKAGDLVILESTCPVGATEVMADWLAEARPDLSFPQEDGEASDIRIAHCPERVLPGKVMHELVSNDRVIGGVTPRCTASAISLYKVFVTGECVAATDPRTAELAKLTENSFRDVNIAFANELSLICHRFKVDVWELISLANRHPRVNILSPGAGVGGHCIAVDPWFIVSSAPKESRLITAAREVNDFKPSWIAHKVSTAVENIFAEGEVAASDKLCVACYGISFKPDIDDLRESPAKMIAERLVTDVRLQLLIVEPNIDCLPAGLEGAALATAEQASNQAQIHLFLVAHTHFRDLCVQQGTVIDVVGIYQCSD